MKELKILVGADPEIFMFKEGTPISAYGAIPGDKKNPYKVANGAVQVDGMALEFNIDPAESEDQFLNNINSVMNTLHLMVPDHELRAVPTANFGFDYINNQPEQAKELGCNPDFNAWEDGKQNEAPDRNLPFRTGAGHIHIGWTNNADVHDDDHFEACIMATRQLDYCLGICSLLWDSDNQRRQMYGKAGSFRPKPYGMEYRVLSNAWLRSPVLIKWVYNSAVKAIRDLFNGDEHFAKWGYNAMNIIDTSGTMSIEHARVSANLYRKAMDLPAIPGYAR
jgi:hypothetical protein